jgi:mono/diheme cytochrome c family protein
MQRDFFASETKDLALGGGADEFNDRQALRTAMLASALAAAAWDATAQDGDVAAGRAFAREACTTCHVVEPDNASPRVVVIGPNFQDIANTKGMTATALRVFLTTSHPKMPNLIFTPEQMADVIAYILSLREHQ